MKVKAIDLLVEFGALMFALAFGLTGAIGNKKISNKNFGIRICQAALVIGLLVGSAAMTASAISYDYAVPLRGQLTDTDIGESACGPTSITMLLNYYYPNSGVLMPDVYRAGLQSYTYDTNNIGKKGPAIGYVDISFPNLGFARATKEFRDYYSGDYSGMRPSPAAPQYLNQIWGGVSTGLSDGSVAFQDVISEIKKRPVIINILYEGQADSGHFIVLRGYDDGNTPDNYLDDRFFVNDPYNKVAPYDGVLKEYSFDKLFGTRVWVNELVNGKILTKTETGWFKRNWITFDPTLSELQRKYTVVIDNIVSNNNFELDDINATDAFGEYIWREFYGAHGGDWLYAIESGQTVKHWAQWKPILLTDGDGYYDINTVFYDNNAGSDVEYVISDRAIPSQDVKKHL